MERTFLVLCLALPDAGASALAEADLGELLRTERWRQAAQHLRGRTATPLADLPAEDEVLARTVADLAERAGRAGHVSIAHLEHARLMLERAALERAIRRARAEGRAGTPELARERERVLEEIRQVVSRLEQAV